MSEDLLCAEWDPRRYHGKACASNVPVGADASPIAVPIPKEPEHHADIRAGWRRFTSKSTGLDTTSCISLVEADNVKAYQVNETVQAEDDGRPILQRVEDCAHRVDVGVVEKW